MIYRIRIPNGARSKDAFWMFAVFREAIFRGMR